MDFLKGGNFRTFHNCSSCVCYRSLSLFVLTGYKDGKALSIQFYYMLMPVLNKTSQQYVFMFRDRIDA